MPMTRITMPKGASPKSVEDLLNRVAHTVKTTLRLPRADAVWLQETSALRVPEGRASFALVEVMLLEGRTVATRERLLEELPAAFEAVGVPSESVRVVLREMCREEYGLGGVPSRHVKIDYELEV